MKQGIFIEKGAAIAALGGKREKIIDIKDIRLPGMHNVENYMAAAGAVWGFAPFGAVAEVAKEFGGVAHRIEFVRN